jgi:hypothetical protein
LPAQTFTDKSRKAVLLGRNEARIMTLL